MTDDELDCNEKKEYPTRILGTGKELLGWLRPGYSVNSRTEQHTEESDADSGVALDRRSYMVRAGAAAAATVAGTAGGAGAVSATGTQVKQPDVYGYGGNGLRTDGEAAIPIRETQTANALSRDDDDAGDDDTSGVVGSGEGPYGGIDT